jgi:hypothetical protein
MSRRQRSGGTEGSNPVPSSGESANPRSLRERLAVHGKSCYRCSERWRQPLTPVPSSAAPRSIVNMI